MSMQFQLKDFDGPLDLLLHLVNQAQVDIRDIFVSQITDQYIDAVQHAADLDMDEASEFLVMAATLLEIKSRAMLPKPPVEEGEETPEDELIRRLEEYRRFKESAAAMHEFEEAAKALFTKLPDEFPLPPRETELVGLTLDGLVEAFARIFARKPVQEEESQNRYAARDIRRDEHSVQECMLTILQGIRTHKGSIRFEEAFSDAPTREEVVTLFLALLELIHLGKVRVEQDAAYGQITLWSARAKRGA